jgi:NitT/TauT family transport system ATP-binding protein
MSPSKKKEGMIIPKIHYSVLQGFMEVLDDLGQKSDIASIALKQGLELDALLPIIDAGKMLGLIDVQTGDVLLTEKGHLFIAASPRVKKKMLREMVIKIDAFLKFIKYMQNVGKQVITKEDLLDFLSLENGLIADNNNSHNSPNEFDWFIEWGRQALILTYDANNETIRLRDKL